MLVVFKSAPILKRVLKVKHELLQLYVLKVRIFHVTGLLKASNSCYYPLLNALTQFCFRDISWVLNKRRPSHGPIQRMKYRKSCAA